MALHSSAAPEPTGSESAPARAADQERPPAGGSASGALLVAAAAILWGTTGTSQALAPPGASSLAVGTARIAIGGLALLAYAAWRSGPKALRALFGRWPLALAGIAGVTGYQLLFFSAVRTTGVALGTLVTLGSSPILVGLLGYALRERLTAAWGGATAIIVTGLALLLLPATAQVRWDGVLTALGAAASYAVYTVVSRALLMRGLSGDAIIGVLFGGRSCRSASPRPAPTSAGSPTRAAWPSRRGSGWPPPPSRTGCGSRACPGSRSRSPARWRSPSR
ncbi:DMT family transporter [Carbonactinospora thermoautotrophica]|uniref:DMT family transporter n=1 Tax=Carbonactinospora thermoautotrophica TaxID=1469144 RepID=UPI000834283D|nr:DMT family transporter [Carbonactinospora thermoautotrophica]